MQRCEDTFPSRITRHASDNVPAHLDRYFLEESTHSKVSRYFQGVWPRSCSSSNIPMSAMQRGASKALPGVGSK